MFQLGEKKLKLLRSFTVHPKGNGSSIGVVLYQRAFFVSKACAEKVQELLGKEPYPTGGCTVSWEGDPTTACSCHVSVCAWVYAPYNPSAHVTLSVFLQPEYNIIFIARWSVAKKIAMWEH